MNEDQHVGGIASALVMLAAVATTFTTYSYYSDNKVAEQYESDNIALEQTASALVSLRKEREVIMPATTTQKELGAEDKQETPELE